MKDLHRAVGQLIDHERKLSELRDNITQHIVENRIWGLFKVDWARLRKDYERHEEDLKRNPIAR